MRSLLLGLFLIFAAAAPLSAADSVPVRSGLHESYGRLVFDWPRRVDYEARIEAGRLVITFGEAAEFQGRVMRDGLAGYAAAPQTSGDGRTLTLPLTAGHGLKHFRLENKVVIDLQKATSEAPKAAETAKAEQPPKQAAAPEADLPLVRVRGGQHSDFSRLVFDWPEPVGNVLEEAPGRARIVFDRPADFDTSGLRPDRLAQVDGVTAAADGVTVEVPEGSRLKVTRSGPKVVMDIYADARPVKQADAPPPVADKAPAVEKPKVADLSPREEPQPKPAEKQTGNPAGKPVEKIAEKPAEAPVTTAPAEAEVPTPLVPKTMGGEVEATPRSAQPPRHAAAAPPAEAVVVAPEATEDR